MGVISKTQWFFRYRALFADGASLRAYRRARQGQGDTAVLRLRAAPEAALQIRPGTTDADVFWDVFFGCYHRPEAPLSQRAVILDLGANIGITAVDYVTLYPDARVVAVEMDGTNAALAAHNLSTFSDRCTVLNAAIWREDGEISYAVDGGEWGYHADPDLPRQGVGAQTVRAVTIDTLMQEQGLEQLDFVKIDIEGAEYEVIQPGAAWLQKTKTLNLEIHTPGSYEHFETILMGEGFSCARAALHPHGLIATRHN